MASWRLAKSLDVMRSQVNAMAQNRSKAADGTIGDQAHTSRKSEHNPNSAGVVRAMDITHDPARGFDSYKFAEMLRVKADPRILYIISNRKIANPGQPWRKYTGTNPHDHHVHVSVVAQSSGYDDGRKWDLSGDWTGGKDASPAPPSLPILRQGSRGEYVEKLQVLLKMPRAEHDGDFGAKTKSAVMKFQKVNGLEQDAVVGFYTWKALEERK